MRKRMDLLSCFTFSRLATRTATASSAIVLALMLFTAQAAHGQSFSVLHSFTNGSDGANPRDGVTVGAAGILYGTAEVGGTHGGGVAFELRQRGKGWILAPLYPFGAPGDGQYPFGGLTVQNGILYGTTSSGGAHGLGTVFALKPPPSACVSAICYDDETILWSFQGPPDGELPYYMNPIFDKSGNMYGTTWAGGTYSNCDGGCGAVWELTPSNGGYTESIIYDFTNGNDGYCPNTSVVLDNSGNLYTTSSGGTSAGGAIVELSPSNGGWTGNTLVDFLSSQDGSLGDANSLVMDSQGNLYGALASGGPGGGYGTVYELMRSGSGWNFSLLWDFTSQGCADPFAGVTLYNGNLYGTCNAGGAYGQGEVFELSNSNGMWTLSDLHDFTGGSDGALPEGNVTFDADGNMYGTTYQGGNTSCGNGCGTVWEITGLTDRK
ncbi:MAG: choice-of-anchor tandem repeat GloVer-containing protein [Candidatus Korobacteraceae bacterium]